MEFLKAEQAKSGNAMQFALQQAICRNNCLRMLLLGSILTAKQYRTNGCRARGHTAYSVAEVVHAMSLSPLYHHIAKEQSKNTIRGWKMYLNKQLKYGAQHLHACVWPQNCRLSKPMKVERPEKHQ